MRLPIGTSAYARMDGRLPAIRLVNMYAEPSPTAESGMVLVPRKGLESFQAFEAGTVRGLARDDGVFGGALFTVAGDKLYRSDEEAGDLDDDGFRAEFAFTVDGLFVLSGGIVYQYDGTDLLPTEFPDDAFVASICDINNILVAVREDTGTVYFRLPGDTVWNALDFFSAEREPDPALAVWALSDVLYVFGSSSIEPFQPTGDAEEPFIRIPGLSITRGVKSRDGIAQLDNTLFFVGEDNKAYRLDGVPKRISDAGIEEQLEKSSSAAAWTYATAGHDFLVINLDDQIVAYDVATGFWHTLDWPVTLGLFDGRATYVAEGANVHLLKDRPDDNGAAISRIFTSIAVTEGAFVCDNLEVQMSPGTAGPNQEPATLLMRWSDNLGRTFTDWQSTSLGFTGQYDRRAMWRRGGTIYPPGRIYEFRITDPVPFRVSGVEINAFSGGRRG